MNEDRAILRLDNAFYERLHYRIGLLGVDHNPSEYEVWGLIKDEIYNYIQLLNGQRFQQELVDIAQAIDSQNSLDVSAAIQSFRDFLEGVED